MKARIYLRIGRYPNSTKFKVDASRTPNHNTLSTGTGNYNNTKKPLSTVLIALDLNIPDKEFDAVRIHLEADITHTEPAVEIRQVEEGE